MDAMNEYELVDACDQNLNAVIFMVDSFFKKKDDGLKPDLVEDERVVAEITRLLTEILDFAARADELSAAGGTKNGKRVSVNFYSPKYGQLILENAGRLRIKEFINNNY
jgi:hypothetical protein